MKKCKSCGYENTDDAQFCESCGASLNGEAIKTEVVAQNVETKKTMPDSKKKGIGFLVLSIFVLVITLAVVAYSTSASITISMAVNSGDESAGAAALGAIIVFPIIMIACGVVSVFDLISLIVNVAFIASDKKKGLPRNKLYLAALIVAIVGLVLAIIGIVLPYMTLSIAQAASA